MARYTKKDDLIIITLLISIIVAISTAVIGWCKLIYRNNCAIPIEKNAADNKDIVYTTGTPDILEYIYTFLFSILIPFVGPVIICIIGLYWLLSKYNRCVFYKEVYETKIDRRYKLNYKYTGNVSVEKQFVRINMEERPSIERKALKKHYVAFICFSVLCLITHAYIMLYML